MFEAISRSSDGIIAIDDIYLDNSRPCQSPGSCNFEQSFCNWVHVDSSNFKWLRISPQQLQTINSDILQTSSLHADVTTGTKYGHFIWIGSDYYSDLLSTNTMATRLMSQTFTIHEFINGGCLSFFANMNRKASRDSLNVLQKIYSDSDPTLIWSLYGDEAEGDIWKFYKIPLQSVDDSFEIFIEVIINEKSNKTSVAIDEIFISTSKCTLTTTSSPLEEFDCGDGVNFVSSAKICNFILDCENGRDESVCGDCEFEEDYCSWSNYSSISDETLWLRGQACASNEHGPSIDHTIGSMLGWYLYVDSNQASNFNVARNVIDKDLKPCSSSCQIDFFYSLKGQTNSLTVYLVEDFETEATITQLSRHDEDTGYHWNRGIIPLGRVVKPFRIEFSGVGLFTNSENYIAIDDIRLLNCRFPPGKYFLLLKK